MKNLIVLLLLSIPNFLHGQQMNLLYGNSIKCTDTDNTICFVQSIQNDTIVRYLIFENSGNRDTIDVLRYLKDTIVEKRRGEREHRLFTYPGKRDSDYSDFYDFFSQPVTSVSYKIINVFNKQTNEKLIKLKYNITTYKWYGGHSYSGDIKQEFTFYEIWNLNNKTLVFNASTFTHEEHYSERQFYGIGSSSHSKSFLKHNLLIDTFGNIIIDEIEKKGLNPIYDFPEIKEGVYKYVDGTYVFVQE